MGSLPFVRAVPGGIELTVKVQPRASRSRLVGLHDGQLKIQLAAAPVDGEANQALVELLAKALDVPRRSVRIVSGESSRQKRLFLEGVDASAIEAVMNAGS